MSEADRLAELAKRRGFYFPANEAYGGTAGFYVYGPTGAALKENIERAWRDRFVVKEGNLEIESPTVMPEAVFEASGHLDGFDDMLVECGECGTSHRADHLVEAATDREEAETLPTDEVEALIADHGITCPTCGAGLAGRSVEDFNLMFGTQIGPGSASPGYLRPETAQGIFVEFPRLAEYARGQLPVGVTQIGPAYRNEISPRKGLVRLREFTQAELELFIDPERDEPPLVDVETVDLPLYAAEDQGDGAGGVTTMTVREAVDEGVVSSPWIAYYLGVARDWYERVGVDMDRFRFRQHLPGERAHYAADCWDGEAEVDGDWIEVTGFAYRSDYDLRNHAEHADEDYTVFRPFDEPRVEERATVDPDMSRLGPAYGDDAPRVVDALQRLAESDPDAFREGDAVTVTVAGEDVEVPVDVAGFTVDEETIGGEHVLPHVIEPSFGVDRLVFTVLAHGHRRDEVDGEERNVLDVPAEIAPTFVGVFPLMDRDGLGDRARSIAGDLRAAGLSVAYDDAGSIGRRYRRQDEVGTPYCVTVDYETLEEDTVTLRDRDSAVQRRVAASELDDELAALRDGDRAFEAVGAAAPDT